MSSSRKRTGLLLVAFFVQFSAAAEGALPTLPGVPDWVPQLATFCAYFVLTILAHIPKVKTWFTEHKARKVADLEVDGQEADPQP